MSDGSGMLSKLWRWANNKPLGASLVAGSILLVVPGVLAWIYSWDLWALAKRVAGGIFDWLLASISIALPMVLWLVIALGVGALTCFFVWSIVQRRPGHEEAFSPRSYREDEIGNVRWRWDWVKDYDGWQILGLAPYCECEGNLIPVSSESDEYLAYSHRGSTAIQSLFNRGFVCISMTCGRTHQTNLPLDAGFDQVKSLVEDEIRTRCRRKIRDAYARS